MSHNSPKNSSAGLREAAGWIRAGHVVGIFHFSLRREPGSVFFFFFFSPPLFQLQLGRDTNATLCGSTPGLLGCRASPALELRHSLVFSGPEPRSLAPLLCWGLPNFTESQNLSPWGSPPTCGLASCRQVPAFGFRAASGDQNH